MPLASFPLSSASPRFQLVPERSALPIEAALPYKFPLILGNDLSSVVVEAGPAVTKFKPGDEIFVRVDKQRIGTLAEHNSIAKSKITLSASRCRACALSAAHLRVLFDLEME